MAKDRIQFVCRSCGGVQPRWMGKCPDCGTWDALEKVIEPKVSAATSSLLGEGGFRWSVSGSASDEETNPSYAHVSEARPLPEIEAQSIARENTGIDEFDRVLGGGLVAGSVVLLGGDPGIGKSTLLLQAAGQLAHRERRVLYVSSEESAYQVKLRAERLLAATETKPASGGQNLDSLFVLAETNLARIIEQARRVQPGVLILDSIQMVFRSDLPASPGSVTQLRRCAMELVTLAKTTGVTVILIGHVTKEGRIAGPRLLKHLVDTVLSFEGDRHHAHRMVRAIKNRFGNTLEVGLFEMTGAGLTQVSEGILRRDPSEPARPGSAVCPAMHGSRCLMVEVQALTSPGFPGSTRRKSTGVDLNRVNLLIAVLEKHGRLRLSDQDVYVSAVGGLRINEPAADLAVALAIAGVATNRSVPNGTAVVGEIGLGGEIRPVNQPEARLMEAVRLGYSRLLVPKGVPVSEKAQKNASIVRVRHLGEAINQLLETEQGGLMSGYRTKSSTSPSKKSGKSTES